MNRKSNIEWTETTWNPSTGCDKISAGCKFCYAENWAKMHKNRGIEQYKDGFGFRIAEKRLHYPINWEDPKIIFVNSMSDLFHEKMPTEYLKKVFDVMNNTPQHIYQILTKRIEKVIELDERIIWTDNIWLGVSVENNLTLTRIEKLKLTRASLKFVSFEPLLEDLDNLNLSGIQWIIVGGESGKNARKIELDWVLKIKNECEVNGIPFFFKQWGKRAFNPDQMDSTINRNHKLHARGGCMIKQKIYKQTP